MTTSLLVSCVPCKGSLESVVCPLEMGRKRCCDPPKDVMKYTSSNDFYRQRFQTKSEYELLTRQAMIK